MNKSLINEINGEVRLHEDVVRFFLSSYLDNAIPFSHSIYASKVKDEKELLLYFGSIIGMNVLKRKDYPEEPMHTNGLSIPFLQKHHCIPIQSDSGKITIVINDPFDFGLQSSLTAHFSGFEVTFCLGTREDIHLAIDRLLGDTDKDGEEESQGMEAGAGYLEDDLEHLKDLAKEAPVVRRVDYLINKALDARASDIHFEPFEESLLVRCRVDGMLYNLDTIPKALQPAIISRLKLMANLDIAERRLPQDGAIKFRSGGTPVDIRLSTAPTLYGESVVLRLLAKEGVRYDLANLGMNPFQLDFLSEAVTQANGLILVTGPTGSGKTTTLYAILEKIKDETKKIITVEDPVEYKIDGINQIQVKPQINLTFANALRSLVRQDPDILLIGEIRDNETADIAVESALTGHLVLSTLHTKSAPGAVTRLRDLNTESFLIADSLLAIVAQRLVRVLCPECKKSYAASRRERDLLADTLKKVPKKVTLYRPDEKGCSRCGFTGYRGREGVFEVLPMAEEVRSAIVAGKDSRDIGRIGAEYGYATMSEHGYAKVLDGMTTISEILRVTSLA